VVLPYRGVHGSPIALEVASCAVARRTLLIKPLHQKLDQLRKCSCLTRNDTRWRIYCDVQVWRDRIDRLKEVGRLSIITCERDDE
jgi:hypothetical protein